MSPGRPRVAVVGANGHGLWHRRNIAARHEAGTLELAALCDLAPVRDEPGAPVPPTARVFTDHREVLASTDVDAVVVATPPHTHLEIAADAARAGADVLLEKPPVLSLAEHDTLSRVLAETGRVCQVGFQALGSAALAELLAALTSGRLGPVRGITSLGLWQRPDSYYHRSPWAGKRTVAGRPTLDGALANPFAHSVMQCLAVAEALAGRPVRPVEVELERFRTRPIEVDDTAVVRMRLDHGPPVVVAVTLCAESYEDARVIVHTGAGQAVLDYTTDRLRLPGEPAPREVPGRIDLLDNLLAQRFPHPPPPAPVPQRSPHPPPPLVAPLARTAAFTALVEVLMAAPPPARIEDRFQAVYGHGPDRVVTVIGVDDVLQRAADELALPSELGAPWEAAPGRVTTKMQRSGG